MLSRVPARRVAPSRGTTRSARVTTRTGDGGDTSLFGKGRVRKTDPRIVALGDLDEAQSAIGVARAMVTKSTLGRELLALQQGLYVAMSDLIPDLHRTPADAGAVRQVILVSAGVATVLFL